MGWAVDFTGGGQEAVDVCAAIEEMKKDSRMEGRLEGKIEGRLEGKSKVL